MRHAGLKVDDLGSQCISKDHFSCDDGTEDVNGRCSTFRRRLTPRARNEISSNEILIQQLEDEIAEIEYYPGHPLSGRTIQIGLTSTSTSGLETTVPFVENILEPELAEYMDAIGLDIAFDFLIMDNKGIAAIALENTQSFKAMGVDLIIGHGWSSQCQASARARKWGTYDGRNLEVTWDDQALVKYANLIRPALR